MRPVPLPLGEVGPETPEVVEAISYLSTAAKWQDNYR